VLCVHFTVCFIQYVCHFSWMPFSSTVSLWMGWLHSREGLVSQKGRQVQAKRRLHWGTAPLQWLMTGEQEPFCWTDLQSWMLLIMRFVRFSWYTTQCAVLFCVSGTMMHMLTTQVHVRSSIACADELFWGWHLQVLAQLTLDDQELKG